MNKTLELQNKIDALEKEKTLTQQENDLLWESNHLFETKMEVYAKSVEANIFNDSTIDISKENPLIYLNGYQVAGLGPRFNTEYWIRCQRWAAWWAMKLHLYTGLDADGNGEMNEFNSENRVDYAIKDDETGEVVNGDSIDPIELNNAIFDAKRFAILFKRAAVAKIDGHPVACSVIKYDKKTKKMTLGPMDYYNMNYPQDGEAPKFDALEQEFTDGVDAAFFDASYLPFGDYVACIPYLGTQIYFEWKHKKTLQGVDLLPIISATTEAQAKEIAKAIVDCERNYFNLNTNAEGMDTNLLANASTTVGATNLADATNEFLDKIRWYGPRDNFKDVLDAQRENLQDLKEEMLTQFGINYTNDNEQTLNQDANDEKEYSDWILMFRIERASEFGMMLDKVFPNKIEETGEELEQKLMEENQIGETIEPDNQNAVKDSDEANTDGKTEKEDL